MVNIIQGDISRIFRVAYSVLEGIHYFHIQRQILDFILFLKYCNKYTTNISQQPGSSLLNWVMELDRHLH
jgi:hypothetical protein